MYFKKSSEFLSVNLQLDKNIIQSFSQLKDIFPDTVGYSTDIHFLFLNFGEGVSALLQLIKLNDDFLTLYIHCYEPNSVFVEFMKWFFWIFSIKDAN